MRRSKHAVTTAAARAGADEPESATGSDQTVATAGTNQPVAAETPIAAVGAGLAGPSVKRSPVPPQRQETTWTNSSLVPSPASERPRSAQLKTYGICLLAGLLIGLIPTGVALIQTRGELETVQRQLRVADLELSLSSAAVLARHGDYSAARDAASRFFSDARLAVDSSDGPP